MEFITNLIQKKTQNKNYIMEIGKMKLSTALPHLQSISRMYGLRLNRANEFKLARLILVNLYNRELV